MNLPDSNWKFDDSVVPVFDEHVKQSVPMYEEIHSLVTDISGWFLQDGTNVYDVGTSTGKVLWNLTERYNKEIQYYGIDNSIEMIEKIKANNPSFELIKQDITKEFNPENASLITSILTMQFIREDLRQQIINSIYNGLNKGGAFIFVEKIVGNNARFNEIWTELYHEMKIKNGLSEKHVFDKSRSIRGVMKPYTIQENMEMLQEAGFKDIDTFFKWNNFVGIVGIK